MAKVINDVKVNHDKMHKFDPDTFVITKVATQDYIEVRLLIHDIIYAIFGEGYYLEFFGYLSKYNGWFACSTDKKTFSDKYFVRLIPFIPETTDNKETK